MIFGFRQGILELTQIPGSFPANYIIREEGKRGMPKKRDLAIRISEAEERLDRLKLEETIQKLRAKLPTRRRRPLTRR